MAWLMAYEFLFLHSSFMPLQLAFLFWEAQRGCFWISPEGERALMVHGVEFLAHDGVFLGEGWVGVCALSVRAGIVMEGGGMIESLGREGAV